MSESERASEAGYIAILREAAGSPPTPEGPGDDAAVIPTDRGGRLVLTTDALVEGVHFFRRHPAEALGWKTLAVNVSDVGAMGATPAAFTLSVALPDDLPRGWFRAFAQGVGACARRYGVALVGGDTVGSRGPVCLSVTAWGWTAGDAVLTRTGGRPDDVLMVHGHIGRAAAGFERWAANADRDAWPTDDPLPADLLDDPCVLAHLRPEPPVAAGAWALAHGARAAMDLSDGLVTDLPRLADASDLALDVDLDQLPRDPACPLDALARADGGEDYALTALVPPDAVPRFVAAGWHAIGLATHRRADDPRSVIWRHHGAIVEIGAATFRHFGGEGAG